MKSSWTGFHSVLAPGIDAFLAHKRALGCLFRVEGCPCGCSTDF